MEKSGEGFSKHQKKMSVAASKNRPVSGLMG
jgi:hypothetical protein